jgi:hypothetical protein
MNKPMITLEQIMEPVSMSDVVGKLSKDDLQLQSAGYNQLMTLEGKVLIDQLRHRADMMRRRAHEFDTMADNIEKTIPTLAHHVDTFSSMYEETLTILAAHAHIKPTKVEGG